MRRGIAIAAAALAAVAVARAPQAWACSCVHAGIRDAYEGASAVFVGTVVSTEEASFGDPAGELVGTVWVTEVFKGDVPATMTVRTPSGTDACGVPLEPADRLAFMGDTGTSGMSITSCGSAWQPDAFARAGFGDPSIVYPPTGPGRAVALGPAIPTPSEPGRAGPIAGGALLIVATAAGHALRVRARGMRA